MLREYVTALAVPGSHVQVLNKLLRYNTVAIDFWLSHCVLPQETRQHEEFMETSAWDLAARSVNGKVSCFMGHCNTILCI